MRKLILALVVIASLTACTGKAKTQDTTATDSTAVEVEVDSVATDVESVDTTATK
jgi:ABC-type glycerol-3-phosphate transport system substrate-binding protein